MYAVKHLNSYEQEDLSGSMLATGIGKVMSEH